MMSVTSFRKAGLIILILIFGSPLCSFFSFAGETFRANINFDGNIIADPGMCYFDVEGLNPGPGSLLEGFVEDDDIYNYNFGEVVFRSYNGRYVLDKKYRKNFNVDFNCTGELALESHMLVRIYPVYGTVEGQKNSVIRMLSLPFLKHIESVGLQLLVNGNPVTTQRSHWLRVGKKTGMSFQLIQLDPLGSDLKDDATLFSVINVIVQPN